MHSSVSGVTDHLVDNDEQALAKVREIVATLGPREQHQWETGPVREPLRPQTDLYDVVPTDSRTPYDVREVIEIISDGLEIQDVIDRIVAVIPK